MVQNFQYGAVGTVIHALDNTAMASAVAGAVIGPGTEIDNTSGAYTHAWINVKLGSAAFVAGNAIDIYIVPSNDTAGGTYPTFTSATAGAWQNYLAATIGINGSTAAQSEGSARPVELPLGKSKVYAITRNSPPTLAASGNLVDLYPFYYQAA